MQLLIGDFRIISQPHIPKREQEVLQRISQMNEGPLTTASMHSIYREIMSASLSLQKDVTVAFLGPRGSFSFQAATERFGDSVSYVEATTIEGVLEAVEAGRVMYGVVPIENSTFGTVLQTLDWFVSRDECAVVREQVLLSVHHCLLTNSPMDKIRRVYSHAQALGQCAKWLAANLPLAERTPVASTSLAAEIAAKEVAAAAISSAKCAELFDIELRCRNIEDMKSKNTKRVL